MAKRLTGKEERKLLFKIKQESEKQKAEEKEERIKKRRGIGRGLRGIIRPRTGKGIKKLGRAREKRAVGTTKVLQALGVVSPKVRAGAGRPRGTYKHGMPVQKYKSLQSRQKALMQIYRQRQLMELQRRGLTPEQVQQIQYVRTVQEGLPTDVPMDVVETPQSVMRVADEELAFTKFRADKTISPNTQRLLRSLRRTQLKSLRDDVEQQRRLKEKRMLASSADLLKTPYIFNRFQMDATGVKSDNILSAPNIFREREDNPSILKPKRLNILQSKEAGTNLKFF